MFNIFLMISNYFHDLSVALLASNIFVIYFLGRFLDKHPEKNIMTVNVFKKLSRITYLALAFILAGGALRAYYFVDFEWRPAVGKGQITALIVKHIILFALTIFGIIAHLKYVKKYGQTSE